MQTVPSSENVLNKLNYTYEQLDEVFNLLDEGKFTDNKLSYIHEALTIINTLLSFAKEENDVSKD